MSVGTSSSGTGTPPLSSSDSSSISEGSQSSIDLSQLNIALANATHPLPNMGRSQARVRARGKGHRRRYSKSHVSRTSVYETIEEEVGPGPSRSLASKKDDTTRHQAIFVVDSDTLSVHSKGKESVWDGKRGIVALRKFYALRDEAVNTVLESKKIWMDTPFSIFALQCKFHFNQTNVSRLLPCPAFQPLITPQECKLCLNTQSRAMVHYLPNFAHVTFAVLDVLRPSPRLRSNR